MPGNAFLSQFYTNAVNYSDELSETMESSIVRYGLKHDEQLLVALTSRKNLRPSTRQVLDSSNSLAVKTAWYSNAGFSSDELKARLGKEKRATVLAALADSPQAGEDLLRLLAQDSRPSVFTAVVSNPNSSSKVLEIALKSFLPGKDLNYQQAALVNSILNNHPSLCNTVARLTSNSTVADHLVNHLPLLDEDVVLKLCQEFIVAPVEQFLITWPNLGSKDIYAVRSWLSRSLSVTNSFLNHSSPVAEKTATALIRLGRPILELIPEGGNYYNIDVDKILALTASEDDKAQLEADIRERDRVIEILKTTDDFSVFEDLLEEDFRQLHAAWSLSKYSFAFPLYLKTVLKNPHLPLPYATRLVKYLGPFEMLDLRSRVLSRVVTKEECAFEAECMSRRMIQTQERFSEVNWPDLLVACRKLEQEGNFALASFPTDSGVPLEVVLDLPWKVVYYSTKRVIDHVSRTLGSDQGGWEIFESLSANFDGSLRQLLETVDSLR